MKFLHKLEKNVEESILGVLLVGMALILMAQILMRVFAKNSLSWAEEIARYFYVWSVFLSIGCTIRMKNILRVDLILEMLPKTIHKIAELVLDLVNVVLYAFLCKCSISVVQNVQVSGQTSPALEIPMYLIYMIIPVGFALASLRSVQKIYFDLTGKNDVKPTDPSESL